MNYNKADFIASYGISSQLPESDRPELSFSGRSNVGKSSLINKLCNRKNLARVSSTPGKTATINFYAVDDCYFVDLTKADKLKKSQLAQTQEEFEKLCLPYGCQKVVLTSGESGYGIPELQAVLNAAVAAEYEANAEDAE